VVAPTRANDKNVAAVKDQCIQNWEAYGNNIVKNNGKGYGALFAWCSVTAGNDPQKVAMCLYNTMRVTEFEDDFKSISKCIKSNGAIIPKPRALSSA
jgi:hypothetical protein